MTIAAKVLLLASLLIIFLQDLRDREVYAFLFPLLGISGSYLFFINSNFDYYLLSLGINIGMFAIILLLNYLFSRFIMKKHFLREALGLGDILFFIAFAVCFPTVAFINFFVFSILFTFALHFVSSRAAKQKNEFVPLAGYMSLFLIAVYTVNWFGFYDSIYLL